jgi:hypothetical protein
MEVCEWEPPPVPRAEFLLGAGMSAAAAGLGLAPEVLECTFDAEDPVLGLARSPPVRPGDLRDLVLALDHAQLRHGSLRPCCACRAGLRHFHASGHWTGPRGRALVLRALEQELKVVLDGATLRALEAENAGRAELARLDAVPPDPVMLERFAQQEKVRLIRKTVHT